jgi:hypothetical protein
VSSGWFGAGVRLWARTELRRRWPSLVLLGVLGGLAAGLAMAAYDGAHRSSTAYQRMRDELNGADAVLFPSQVLLDDFDPQVLDSIPEVESWAGFAVAPSSIDGLPPFSSPFITTGDWFTSIEGAEVLEGRLPDPDRDDEAVITPPVAADEIYDIRVGSKLVWRNLSFEQARQFETGFPDDFEWSSAAGVVTELTVVGVVRLPMESVTAFASDGLLLASTGWADAHLDQTPVWFTNALVRLRNGAADLPALHAGLERVTGRSDIPVKDLSTDIKRVQRSLDLERTALLMFAAAIAVTALVLVGQAVVRATASGIASVPPLRALGATSASLALGLALPMVVTVGALVATTAVVSVVASRWFPVGLARNVDPDLGTHVVASREAVGLTITALVAVGLVVITSIVMQHQLELRQSRRTRVMSAAMHSGVPVPAAIGASLAVDASPERGRGSRFALPAAIVGVVAVVGALTLVRGIDEIVGHPERTGSTWDLEVTDVGAMADDEANQIIEQSADVADIAIARRVATLVGGFDVPLYSLEVRKGSMSFTVVDGRGPRADDEIALGPATKRLLDADVGDTIRVGPEAVPMRVVGVALLSQTPHSSFDEGAWITTPAYDSIALQIGEGETAGETAGEAGFLGLVEGVDADDAIGRLPPNWSVSRPAPSNDLANLLQVRSLPIYLAAFLAFLAVGAVAHALFTSARQRARELAVLRALGLTARQIAVCVSWQALVIGAFAAAVGVPLGVIAGRRVWRGITEELSFVYVGPLARAVVVLAAGACLVGCALLAIVPARATARRDIADTLREE